MTRPRLLMVFLALVAATLAAGAGAAAASGSAGSADRCLRGDWRISNAAVNDLLQRIVPVPSMQVSRGVLTASFNAAEARYGSTFFNLTQALGPLSLTATATFLTEARYTTRSGRLVVAGGTSELVISKFTAVKDGRQVTVPGPAPTTRSIPAGSTPYTCTASMLRWRMPIGSPSGTWVTFRRVR